MSHQTDLWFRLRTFLLCLLGMGGFLHAESVNLDGIEGCVDLAPDTALHTPQFTIETWFKRASGGILSLVTNTYPLISGGNGAPYHLGIGSNGRLFGRITSSTGTSYGVSSPSAIPLGEWHHAALTYDGSVMRVYLDGQQVASTSIAVALSVTTTGTRLGGVLYNGTGDGAFAGQLDEVRFWNYARSQAEISLHRNVALTFTPGLLARWGFDGTNNPATPSDGMNQITATLMKTAAYTADAPQFVQAPIATIIFPANPLAAQLGDVITLQSTASDADDAVTKVEYYNGSVKLGEATTAPYSLHWGAGPSGPSVIAAVATDAAGHRNGSATRLTVTTQIPAGTKGVYFDGLTGAASVASSNALFTPAFTVETWFLADGNGTPVSFGSFGSACSLLFRGTSPGEFNYLLAFRPSDNRLLGGFSNGYSNSLVAGSTAIARGEWHHAAVTFDGAIVRLFLDGNLENQSRVPAMLPITTTAPVHLGALATSYDLVTKVSTLGGFFSGVLAESRIWNYARPLEAIRRARALPHPSVNGMIARWPMDDLDGTLLANPSGAPATLAGTTQRTSGPPLIPGVPPVAALISISSPLALTRDQFQVLQATASDSDGTVSRVEYWDQATKLGESTNPPYAVNWSALPIGRHWLSAVAVDDQGLAGTSAPVQVDVAPPAGTAGLYLDSSYRASVSTSSLSLLKFTVECWFRRESLGRPYAVDGLTPVEAVIADGAGFQNTHGLNYLLGIRASDGVVVGMSGSTGSTFVLGGTTSVPYGVWKHAALSYDGVKLRLYVDGLLEAEATPLPVPAVGSSPVFSVGSFPASSTGGSFFGNVDEIRVWNFARTSAEILGAHSQALVTAPGLLAHWGLEGNGTSSGSLSLTLNFNPNAIWTTGFPQASGTAPGIAITNPAEGGTAPMLSPLNVTFNTSDADGSVVRVELYQDGLKVGESTTAPFSMEVVPTAIGAHTLRAFAVDDSGLVTSAPTVTYQAGPPSGLDGLFFDGVDDYVLSDDDPSLGLAQFTVETWFKRETPGVGVPVTGISSVVPLVARGSAVDGFNFFLGITSNSQLAGVINAADGSTYSVTSASNTIDNQWHHAAMSYDGKTLRLFLDGIPVNQTSPFVAVKTASPLRLAFGATVSIAGTRSGAFGGFLDEVRIWNYARSGVAIEADRFGTELTVPGLLARWAFATAGSTTGSSGSLPVIFATLTGGVSHTVGRPNPAHASPSVSLGADKTTVAVGESLTLTSIPASTDGPLAKVEFFSGESKVGESLSAPWTFEYAPSAPGSFFLTAVATLSTGEKAASNSVPLLVSVSPGVGALYFDGTDDFVKLPPSAELSLPQYTLEAWVRRDGLGQPAGATGMIPIIARGLSAANQTGDFLLGIDQTKGCFAATYGTSGTATAVVGRTNVASGVWYHVAITSNSSVRQLYVNGVLESSVSSSSLQPTSSANPSLGTALDLSGVRQGAFSGTLDEVRIWSVARTPQEIATGMNREIHRAPGLVGRWGFSEAGGGIALDSGAFALQGTLLNGVIRTAGVSLAVDAPPAVTLDTPANGATGLSEPLSFTATIDGEVGENLSATFLRRDLPRGATDFTVVVIPDIANYTASQNGGSPTTLQAMLDWVVAQRAARNIVFVTHTGSIAAGGDAASTAAQTQIASDAFAKLEDPAATQLPTGLPFGLAAGDGDTPQLAAGYETYFGGARFSGRPWYGGASSFTSNANHLEFFSAGDVDFAVAHLASSSQSAWLQTQITQYPNRRFIVVYHDLLAGMDDAPLTANAQSLFSFGILYSNVTLLLGGHVPGEWRCSLSPTIHALSANYASRPNGGNGWLRLLEFSPATNRIHVRTYSPTLDQYETDDDSDFTLAWSSPVPIGDFSTLATINPASPGQIGTSLAGLSPGRQYEWTAQVSDAVNTVVAPFRRFTAAVPAGAPAPVVTLTYPTTGTSVGLPSTVFLAATASSPDNRVERMEFLLNGCPLFSFSLPPYQKVWRPASPGTYTLTARATDIRGLQTTSAPVSITVSPYAGGNAPSVSITSPANGESFFDSDTTIINATASVAGSTIASMQFFADGQLLGTDTVAPFSADWNFTPSAVSRTIQVIATTALGTSEVATISVNVSTLGNPFTTRLPYLQMGSPDAMSIRWRTLKSHRGRVRYGTTLGALNMVADENALHTDHEVRLTGLIPNTRYYYSIGTKQTVTVGGDAATYFSTQPPVGRARATRIWALGDSGTGAAGQISTRDAYYSYTGTRDTDLLLLLGDNAYNSGLDSEYQSNFFNVYAAVLRKAHTCSTIGNHETAQSSVHNPAYTYYDVFSLPTSAECGGTPSGTEQWYSFNYGNIHFIALDSMTASRATNGAMATWLAADLAASSARWNIAFWHHPPYTHSGYDSDNALYEGYQMRTNLLPILEANGVDLVLSGHDHIYERSWFMSGHYGLGSTFNAAMKKAAGLGRPGVDGPYVKNVNATESNQGTVYVVTGSAATLYPGPYGHNALPVGLSKLGSAVLDVSGNRLSFSFLTSTGTVDDSFTIIKPYGTTDSDGDGLPDDYEVEYGLDPHNPVDGPQDTDGDGSSNRDEFLAGTDPQDSGSLLLTTVQPDSNGYLIRFKTTAGYTYTVQRRDSLTTGDWSDLATNLLGTGQERTVSDTTPGPAGKRFYRVRVQPQ